MNKAKRIKRANAARKLYDNLRCLNCKLIGSHFVPASLGEPGFYTCNKYK